MRRLVYYSSFSDEENDSFYDVRNYRSLRRESKMLILSRSVSFFFFFFFNEKQFYFDVVVIVY